MTASGQMSDARVDHVLHGDRGSGDSGELPGRSDHRIQRSPTVLADSFETASHPPPIGSKISLPYQWEFLRDAGISARTCSNLDATPDNRAEFLEGARALGLIGRRKTLKPQQLLLADTLNAGNRFTSVLLPRRSSKTTSLLAWLVGRCLGREDYLCAYAVMTSQKKARDRFLKDVVPILERTYPDEEARPFKIRKANGQERLEFANGSVLQFLGPNPDDYRSDAYDVIVLDEAGEAEAEVGEEVLSAALPTQDTRPGAMIVLAGTAGEFRVGQMLWDELEAGRAGEARHGILDYSRAGELTDDELADWDTVRAIVLAAHPGLYAAPGDVPLTTIENIEDNWRKLDARKFAREYLGIFGTAAKGLQLITPDHWTSLALGQLPEPPSFFAIGVAVDVYQRYASIVAAWRVAGIAHVAILQHERGTRWLASATVEKADRYGVDVAHDDKGPVTAEVVEMRRFDNFPVLRPQGFRDVTMSAALLIKEIEAGNLRHYGQPDMDRAALAVKRRMTGTAWALGRTNDDDIISPIEAAALALKVYDQYPAREVYIPAA